MTKIKINKILSAPSEFKIGKHHIGYVSSDFTSRFSNQKFSARTLGKFQTLPRYMNDAKIESELKPGICELGDVIVFLDNAPEECKDGNWNLFYTKDFVVSVYWDAGVGGWYVGAWDRDDDGWGLGNRVFSPATENSETGSLDSGPMTLESAIDMVKKAGFQVSKIL